MKKFDKKELENLYKPARISNGEDNGQVTIIGGSVLFHGAPFFSLKVASRIVDMVFFSSPEKSVSEIALGLKSRLFSFIWTPWDDVEEYIKKSDAVLIGPGFMRFKSEKSSELDRNHNHDGAGQISREITKRLLTKFPDKRWVIDAGSLQTMDTEWIPEGAILTPNKKEYTALFGEMDPAEAARRHKCIIVRKGPVTSVYARGEEIQVEGGNPGMTKGGTGDVQAGLTVALFAKNEALLSAAGAAYVVKRAAEELAETVGTYFNADDLANQVPKTLHNLTEQ